MHKTRSLADGFRDTTELVERSTWSARVLVSSNRLSWRASHNCELFSLELSVRLQTCYKESWELNSAAIAVSNRKNGHKHESLMCILQMSLLTSIACVCLFTSRIWWLFMVILASLSGLVGRRGLLLAETIWKINQQIEEELRDLLIKLTEMCMQIDSQTSINYTTLTTSSTACFTISIE